MMEFLNSPKVKFATLFLGIYLLSTGISWAGFMLVGGKALEVISPVSLERRRSGIDPQAPKTETCPLNGAKHTKAERDIWQQRRPLTVMVENHEEARPQSGLSRADIVYEAVAEGGITRLLAVFYCGASTEDLIIGPVRSARVYFIDWASEYGDFPLYTHVGGANRPGPADALGQISKIGWLAAGNDLNQFSIGFPTFWRDYERIGHPVATEHTMYASTDKLWEIAQKRGLTQKTKDKKSWDSTFRSWKFEQKNQSPQVNSVSFPFWEGYKEYFVKWTYDTSQNVWKRENDGKLHTDLNNKEQIQASTIIVQFANEKSLGDPEKHLLYQTTGKGKALVFQAGQVIEANWEKRDRTSRTLFSDKRGEEIAFVPGQIWIEVLPIGTKVTY